MRHKKIATIILACACFAGMMQTARAQETKVNEDKGIAGYLNSKTGAFTPMAQKVADTDALAAIVATTGKFVFNFTITVTSTVPKNGLVLCEGDANVFESSTGQSIFERVSGTATKGTGSTYTCSLPMPYSWVLSTPTTDMATLSYRVQIVDAFQITATNGTGVLVSPNSLRQTQQNIGSIKIPATGSTTTETVTATQ